jgi:hypothetical protein
MTEENMAVLQKVKEAPLVHVNGIFKKSLISYDDDDNDDDDHIHRLLEET